MSEQLIARIDHGVGSIVLNRPEALNAFTAEMAAELPEIVDRMERDPAVRAVLIRGEGRSFTAGGDVKGFHAALIADRAAHAAGMEKRIVTGHLTMHRIRRMPKPVLVAFQGITAGLGVSLVACADLAMAADDAELMLAYRHVGLSVDGGVSHFLPRIVGERRAMQITLLGERIDAATALDWGLANWVVPVEELTERATNLARDLAQGPTVALAASKRLLRDSLQRGWDEQSAAEACALSLVAASDDHFEGVSAFVEKRSARYEGR
ncbi:enoyl-CoA hydratase/isomerase family protein [Leptolyngbya sp. 15MV]|nr:enoyl-CoA hydratase/isomerase family protein [Leptolyngbya sp. 15MV]